MKINKELMNEKQLAGYLAIGFTLLYLALFFPSFYTVFLDPALYQSSKMTITTGVIITFLSVSVPASIVAAIYGMWFKYVRAKYKGVYFFCALPLITCCLAVVLSSVVRFLVL